ncbi:MAG: hypothetical protein NC548_27270 [Lachnospiraceae bacterium]|nr:hypothetical protein [Lachnospiraceae bacterium]
MEQDKTETRDTENKALGLDAVPLIKQKVDAAVAAEAAARAGAISTVTEKVEANATGISNEATARQAAIAEATQSLQNSIAQDLQSYYTKTETDQMVSAIPKFKIEPVETLPTDNISDSTVYLLKSGEEADNLYTEYIYVNGQWEKLGEQKVDLTGYLTTADAATTYATKNELNQAIGDINAALTKIDTGEGV